ncbi:MAG: DNA-binding protein [Pseudonocardia sp.]|jgi:CspA family cold shock protein|nr:DNA-binding protein [Pseudonocardia sp.]
MRFAAWMMYGTVKFFKTERGWGAISSPDLPANHDAFIHFSVIEAEGFRSFEEGDRVEFDYVPAQQDSFRYVATRARKI